MGKGLKIIVIANISAFLLGGCGRESVTDLEDVQLSIGYGKEDGEENGVPESNQEGSSQPGEGSMSDDGGRESEGMSAGNGQGNIVQGGSQGTEPEREAMAEAYIAVLEDIFVEQKFPGDQDYGYQPVQGSDVTANQFAVYDIDGDGKEELLITWTTTYTAGQAELVYGFDSVTGTVREELRAYPLLAYFDNGVVEEQMSHNHGMAPDGDFWPYILHQYDKEEDRYEVIASVDAWSRAYREEDYDGNPFPAETDADGDGMVYYMMEGGTYALEDPVDGEEYQRWRDSYIRGAQQIRVPYVKLTLDNIHALGSGVSDAADE